jgi:NAD(P)-dependent dehydrogenase (short-subunit alcohol dehydrogenase family)
MKNYLIIGASSGIGKSLAEILSNHGHNVIGTYNSTEVTASDNVSYHALDVMDDELDLSFVPEQLDGIVYCPGSINLKPFHRIKPENFIEDLNLQVVGAIKVIQAILGNLKKGEHPSILLFSTVAVQMGFNFHTQVSVSKGAIEGLTKALAAELAPTIRVNCIAPSLTDTPLAGKLLSTDDKKQANAERHPLKKIGTPEDISEMAAFLLSDKAKWMSGQIIHIDGGASSIKM